MGYNIGNANTLLLIGKEVVMNRKGENSFNQEEEKAKYEVGMDVFLKDKEGKIIYTNEHYITIQFEDGIKESFIWHELFDKYEDVVTDEEEEPEDALDDLSDEDLEEELEEDLEEEGEEDEGGKAKLLNEDGGLKLQ